MPLPVATVTGALNKPDGTPLENGRVYFTLSGMAAADNVVTGSAPVVAITGAGGAFSVNLMPNEEYDYPTHYSVVGYDYDEVQERTSKGYDFGKIRVPVGGGPIEPMLGVPVNDPADKARIFAGDTLLWVAVYVDDILHPIDLTGATVTCDFVRGAVTESATIDMTDAANGRVVIEADTTGWAVGQYQVRFSVTLAGIKKTQVGKLEVFQ